MSKMISIKPIWTVAVAGCLLLTACVVPDHMHVTEGTFPQNVDTNVRFRTTYYFRVFDYCWQGDAQLEEGKSYRDIIPESDVVYRYRMTGKASALGTNIHFEAGTLDSTVIDPFGSDLVYNSDIGGYLVRSRDDARLEAHRIAEERAARNEREGALARFEALSAIYSKAVSVPADPATLAALQKAMADALAAYSGRLTAPLSDDDRKRFDEMNDTLLAIDMKLKSLIAQPTSEPPKPATVADVAASAADAAASKAAAAVVEDVREQIARLTTQSGAAKPFSALCPAGGIKRRGFQIMGPEGMREFDQDKRLILAMYTSAKPLTETLQEYAGRVLSSRVNPAEQLLPIAQETIVVMQAERALDALTVRAATEPLAIEEILSQTLDAFGRPDKQP